MFRVDFLMLIPMNLEPLKMINYAVRNMDFIFYAWICFPSICCDVVDFMKTMLRLCMSNVWGSHCYAHFLFLSILKFRAHEGDEVVAAVVINPSSVQNLHWTVLVCRVMLHDDSISLPCLIVDAGYVVVHDWCLKTCMKMNIAVKP
jgi:hypothetical protein